MNEKRQRQQLASKQLPVELLGVRYGFKIHTQMGTDLVKMDPYAQEMEVPSDLYHSPVAWILLAYWQSCEGDGGLQASKYVQSFASFSLTTVVASSCCLGRLPPIVLMTPRSSTPRW